jgi:hypothetical protein
MVSGGEECQRSCDWPSRAYTNVRFKEAEGR